MRRNTKVLWMRWTRSILSYSILKTQLLQRNKCNRVWSVKKRRILTWHLFGFRKLVSWAMPRGNINLVCCYSQNLIYRIDPVVCNG